MEILDRIIESKQIASAIVRSNPNRLLPFDPTAKDESQNIIPDNSKLSEQVYDPFAKNDPTLDPNSKSYLARYHYQAGGSKPTLTKWDKRDESEMKVAPLDITKGEYIDGLKQNGDYNLDFEPHPHTDKIMVDPDNNEFIGIQRTSGEARRNMPVPASS